MHHLHHLIGAAQFEQVLDQGLVLAGQDMRRLAQRIDILGRLGRDAQRRARPGGGATHRGPVQALENGDLDAVRQFAGILELGDGTDVGVPPSNPGDEQDELVALTSRGDGGLCLLALQRDRDDHVRHHHAVVEREQGDEFSF